jgi:anthranilate synthase/aminodeoxychorismate synthase-like glutamine amidotransferase
LDRRVLIIDHFDSFTYNLVGLLDSLGVHVDVIQYGERVLSSVSNYHNIILSPGPGVPEDYPITFYFLEKFGDHKNILGVCLGHQIIGIAFGAQLKHQGKVVHGKKRLCYPQVVSRDSLYDGLPVPFEVGLYHSWIVVIDDQNPYLEIRSICEEGKIMGLKHKIWSVEGVQFHPESYMTSYGDRILKNWLSRGNEIR